MEYDGTQEFTDKHISSARIANWEAERERLKSEPPSNRRNREIEVLDRLIEQEKSGGEFRKIRLTKSDK